MSERFNLSLHDCLPYQVLQHKVELMLKLVLLEAGSVEKRVHKVQIIVAHVGSVGEVRRRGLQTMPALAVAILSLTAQS